MYFYCYSSNSFVISLTILIVILETFEEKTTNRKWLKITCEVEGTFFLVLNLLGINSYSSLFYNKNDMVKISRKEFEHYVKLSFYLVKYLSLLFYTLNHLFILGIVNNLNIFMILFHILVSLKLNRLCFLSKGWST